MLRSGETLGYGRKTNKFVDMYSSGIIDPTKVTRTPLEKWRSVVSTILTTECMVVNKKEEKQMIKILGMNNGGGILLHLLNQKLILQNLKVNVM